MKTMFKYFLDVLNEISSSDNFTEQEIQNFAEFSVELFEENTAFFEVNNKSKELLIIFYLEALGEKRTKMKIKKSSAQKLSKILTKKKL